MNNSPDKTPGPHITKSDFLLYCETPRHLWAKKHGLLATTLSDFDRHLIDEGGRVEALGHEYLETILIPQRAGASLHWQETYNNGPYEIRLDALLEEDTPGGRCLYEIKSGSSVDKEIVYDVAFQAAVLEKHFPVDRYIVLDLNKEYTRSGELDLARLFIAEDVTEKVRKILPEVEMLREDALRVAQLRRAEDAQACLSPNDCPCPAVCHPDLPEFSIFDIPRLDRKKKVKLLEEGIRSAKDIPPSFELNAKQRLVADLARTGREHIDRKAISAELDRMRFPLFFLDYETCICAVPPYDGCHPQQQIVFQYSLHRIDRPDGEPAHFEHISIGSGDPALPLLQRLREDIGQTGTVLVWNKTFEMTRNREMADLHSQFAPFLEQLNNRISDLGDLVNLGYYLHPEFKGSWSIKNVLPAMVPELSYKELAIGKGDQASMAWWRMTFGELDPSEMAETRQNLLDYCRLDTLAMVEIFRKFVEMIR